METESSRNSKILSVSLFYSHFPGEPGLASFVAVKDDGRGGDNWSYKTFKAPVKSCKLVRLECKCIIYIGCNNVGTCLVLFANY